MPQICVFGVSAALPVQEWLRGNKIYYSKVVEPLDARGLSTGKDHL